MTAVTALKVKERTGNVLEKKGSARRACGRTGNVIENKRLTVKNGNVAENT
jgi:hypothetical protein